MFEGIGNRNPFAGGAPVIRVVLLGCLDSTQRRYTKEEIKKLFYCLNKAGRLEIFDGDVRI